MGKKVKIAGMSVGVFVGVIVLVFILGLGWGIMIGTALI